MKSDVAKLQRDIDRFQHELASATSGVLTIHDSLDACYQVQKNIDESIEKLQQCQRIVRLASSQLVSICLFAPVSHVDYRFLMDAFLCDVGWVSDNH